MKRFYFIVAMLVLVLATSTIAKEQIQAFEFESDPNLQSFTQVIPDSKNSWVKVALPIPETKGNSFAVEFDLNIKTFNHYARVQIGLDNGKSQCFDLTFSKGDNRINTCNFRAQRVAGLSPKLKPFENVEAKKMHVRIYYNSAKRSLDYIITDMEGKELFNLSNIKVLGKINLSRFVIGVEQNNEEASEISYDPDLGALFCLSYVGAEGEYAYIIECFVDNIAIAIDSEN